jgi:hypothetical protein
LQLEKASDRVLAVSADATAASLAIRQRHEVRVGVPIRKTAPEQGRRKGSKDCKRKFDCILLAQSPNMRAGSGWI